MTALGVGALVVLVVLVGWRARPGPSPRLAGLAAGWRRGHPPHRRRPVDAGALAGYLDEMARELRVGATLGAAFTLVTPASAAGAAVFGRACRAVVDGLPLSDALGAVVEIAPDADVVVVVQALRCAAAVGGPAAATLDAAAAVLRERAAVAADLRTQSAQARLSARILTVVPIAFALWTLASSARTCQAYLASGVGVTCAVAGATLNVAGWWWMHRIVGRSVR